MFRRNISNSSACHLLLRLISCSACYSTLKMEAICSFETSVEFKWTTQHHIPEVVPLRKERCENIRSYNWGETVCRDILVCKYRHNMCHSCTHAPCFLPFICILCNNAWWPGPDIPNKTAHFLAFHWDASGLVLYCVRSAFGKGNSFCLAFL
jgi:hypothetical protein